MVSMTNVDFHSANELAGEAEIVSFEYAGLEFQVPSYPNIVASYRNEEIREGYLIQLIPGKGFRFIYTELPEWEVGPDGKERQLEAPDEFGPVVPTLESAMASALDNLYDEDGNPSVAGWATRLDRDLKAMRRSNIIRDYSEESFGYLIQEMPEGRFRLVIIGEGEDEPGPELDSLADAVRSAHKHWQRFGIGGDEAYYWSKRLAEDAKAFDEEELKSAVVQVLIEEANGALTEDQIQAMATRILALAGN